MNKSELIELLAQYFGGNRAEATRALNAVLDVIMTETARGERVSITGFGAFERSHRTARVVRNPATGERKAVDETWVPKFRAGAEFRRIVADEAE